MKKYIAILFLLVLIVVALFIPKRIVSGENIRIDYIMYNSGENADLSEGRVQIKEYDSDKITEILSKYKSQLTLSRSRSYSLNDCKLEIHMSVNGKSKNVVLGKNSFESGGYGSFKKRIINADELLRKLLEVITKE